VEIARVLQHHRVNYLAVAVADEGAELRKSGIYLPIAVMNPELSAFNVLIENQLEPEIYSFKLLKEFTEAVSKLALTHYPVHLKIDTGMHRLGFDPEDIPGLIDWLQQHNEIVVKSVFSHLAGSDSPDLDYFTHQQAEKFRNAAQLIENALSYPVMKHLLNSAGIERFPQYQHNMVRLGIGHYGISALPDIRLPQVCALKTIILQIKEIPGGETIGYSRKWKLSEDRKIAVLPIGYADGYSRRLSNGVGEVYVGGRKVPVVGNVSMDLITIDVTGVDVSEGDTVEIFGDHITISELAEKIQTIPYEILTGVSRRVKRVYYQE
jgi:alanine racemase